MSGVCAASDIWSVGCTVIELLTCLPPYFNLQPMTALFRIVQDEHPPIPDRLSPAITDFLYQCFKKDSRQRPDAKTLLSHPWIQNSRRSLQTSLRHSGTLRNIEEVGSVDAELSKSKQMHSVKTSSAVKEIKTELLSSAHTGVSKSSEDDDSNAKITIQMTDKLEEDQFPTFSNEKSPRQSSVLTNNHDEQAEVLKNGEVEPHESAKRSFTSRKFDGKESSAAGELVKPNFAQKRNDQSPRKAVSGSINSERSDLNRFSDQPGDASLDDLFHPLNDRAAEASTSSSSSHVNRGNNDGKNDLATKLRATIAQKQMDNDSSQANGSGDLLHLMMGILKEDGFEDKLHAENLFHLQAVEFSKLVSSLRPDEPEDVIVSACQKLTTFFHQRPDLKIVFITQHGLLPLVELLEVPRTRVICSVLQVLNQIIKDNTDFQHNACLVGLIPIVMSFAMPDRPIEIRTEAAYFFQQLCESSSLTLQMFIACRGIPILVGFLEADHAKYREIVHIAIDGMWQILKLQKSTSRNDFCRMAAKNGILLRLINTLYSLNEAARLASRSGFPSDGIVPRPRSSQLHPTNPSFLHVDTSYGTDHPDILKVKQVDQISRTGLQEPSRNSVSLSPKSTAMEASSASKVPDPASFYRGRRESVNRLKNEPSRSAVDVKQRSANAANKISTDKATKSVEVASNGSLVLPNASQQENVRPLLSLLDKEPPSRHFSGQLEYVRHLTMMEKHESNLPHLHASNDKQTNRLDFLMAEFAGSGVLNARPGSSTSSGLLSHMVSPWNVAVAREYLEKVTDLLLEFAAADSAVKSFMCSKSLLSRLFQMFNKTEPPILLKLLKCINHLSTDPYCLEHLQRAHAIQNLIPNLDLKEGPLVSQIHHEVLNALFNLCKINKKRQEQAAENGIIPHLMQFIMSDSPLRQYALPLLCDMAYASRNSREQLRAHGGLDVYLSLLEDEIWCVTALDSVAVCLAHDNENRKVEQALLKKDAVQKLVKFFQCCPEQLFLHILEPFLKIITRSPKINITLAVNGLTALLINKLDNPDAIARLNLLRMIKVVYEHHPRPKQLIIENNLPQKLQNLIEERRDGQSYGGQVLVKQLATSLLKALHINTVF